MNTEEFNRLAEEARAADHANAEAQAKATAAGKAAREAKRALLSYVEQVSGVQRLWL